MLYKAGEIIGGKYRVEKLVGEGAFGEVYLATHLKLNTPRALKVLSRETPGVGSTEFERCHDRFTLEAQLGASLKHPNLVPVFDFEDLGQTLVLAMEYCPGGSLVDRLTGFAKSGERMPVEQALRIAIDVAGGLGALHAKDGVHRDLKPSNILFDEQETARLADLGLAQIKGGGSQRSKLRSWSGSRASLAWGRPTPEEQVEHARNMALYRRYLRDLVAAKSLARGDDFASALLDIRDEDPDALTHEDVASILFSLSFAGHETTNNLIGNTVVRLLEDRSRWERLLAEPRLIGGAVDEVLRYDPSVVVWRRVTTRATVLGGTEIPPGAKLFLWLFATGRDAAVFPDPDVFDPERRNARRTLAFGRGIHFCVGSVLGRLEATVAIEELQRRFPTLEAVAGREVPYHPNISFRGPQHLWVRAA